MRTNNGAHSDNEWLMLCARFLPPSSPPSSFATFAKWSAGGFIVELYFISASSKELVDDESDDDDDQTDGDDAFGGFLWNQVLASDGVGVVGDLIINLDRRIHGGGIADDWNWLVHRTDWYDEGGVSTGFGIAV